MTSDGIAHAPSKSGVGRDLPRLTSLRGFAALAVFFFHLVKNTEWALGGTTVRYGYVGVAFFFILSGFVLTWSTRPSVGVREFYMRRFARVYPSHFVMLLVALALPLLPYPKTPEAFLASLTLTQAWFPQWPIAFGMNAVSWSLSGEFFFYACTPFLLRALREKSDRVVIASLVGWYVAMSAVAIAMATASNQLDVWAYTLPIVRSGEFTLGVMAGLLAIRGRLPRIPQWVGLVAIGAAWLVAMRFPLPQSVADVVFALPFLVLIIGAASADIHDVPAWFMASRPLIYAGQVSFAFYLVHELAIINGNPLWGSGPDSTLGCVGLTVAVFAMVSVLSIALHELVEKPVQRRIRALTAKPRAAGVTKA